MIFIWKQSGTSHGKSACDGIGGTVRRPATKASLKRPAHNQILTPLDMFSYCESDVTGIKFLVVFFFTEKNYLMSSLAMSVRPSVRLSVCPSSVEISLERGCSITNMPIDLKFGPIIGGRVMHV